MSAPTLSYFLYPNNLAHRDDFQSWICSICTSSDPDQMGGTAAHESYRDEIIHIDGRRHPIHLDCLLASHQWTTLCPDCRVNTDSTPLIPLSLKWSLIGRRILNSLPEIIARSKNHLSNPLNQVYGGTFALALGITLRKHPLASLGMGLQAYGIYQAIEYGSYRITISSQIKILAKEIIFNIRRELPFDEKLGRLKSITASHPKYLTSLSRLIDSPNQRELLRGLNKTLEFIDEEKLADRIVRFWGGLAAFGSILLAVKCFSNFKSGRGTFVIPSSQGDSTKRIQGLKWLIFEIMNVAAQCYR